MAGSYEYIAIYTRARIDIVSLFLDLAQSKKLIEFYTKAQAPSRSTEGFIPFGLYYIKMKNVIH